MTGRAPFPERPSPGQGLAAFALAFVSGNVVSLVSGVGLLLGVAAVQGVTDPEALEGLAEGPFVTLGTTTVLQLVMLGAALVSPWLFRASWVESLAWRPPPLATLFVAPLAGLALAPSGELLRATLEGALPELSLGNLDAIKEVVLSTPIPVALVVVAVLPALAEEFLFRGVLQRSFGDGLFALVIATLAFALIHLDPVHVIGVLPVGFFLGWLVQRTDSIFPSVAVHFVNNGAAVAAVHLEAAGFGEAQATGSAPLAWAVGGLACFVPLVAFLAYLTRGRDGETG